MNLDTVFNILVSVGKWGFRLEKDLMDEFNELDPILFHGFIKMYIEMGLIRSIQNMSEKQEVIQEIYMITNDGLKWIIRQDEVVKLFSVEPKVNNLEPSSAEEAEHAMKGMARLQAVQDSLPNQ